MMRFTFRRDDGRPGAPPRISRRGALLLGAQAVVSGALLWRLKTLQIDASSEYLMMAEENRINVRLIPPARGLILDRKGRQLAVNRQNYRVVMVREQAGDIEAVLDDLARIIDIPPHQRSRILREIRSKSAFVPVTVAENLDWESFARINANAPALPGVAPEVGLTRHYPEGEALGHVIGYVARFSEADKEREDADDALFQIPDFHIGKTGVERARETTLRGAAGASRIEVNAVGRVIREIDRTEGAPGSDIGLTIDLDLQRYALERIKGESAAVVVMEIDSGDILALASAPGFDPNKFVVGISQADWSALLNDDHRPLANKTVSGLYPPGSTFKMVVALAALEAGVVGPREGVYCNGRYKLGNRFFHCWRRGGHGHVNMRDSLKFSCDVYFYEVARRVGVDRIAAMANRLGLGVRPDLAITAIQAGLTPTREWKQRTQDEAWQVGDTLNAGIGQGYVLASPIQLATMAARLGGGGRKVEPRLIRSLMGEPVPVPEAEPLGISPAHLRLVREGMFAVSNERSGTAYRSRIADPAMAMAGKTGTSQVRRITAAERARGVTKNKDLPWERRDHALFVAFAPYDRPRYSISVIVEHGGGGSAVAAPIARDVMMRALYGAEPPLRAYPAGEREEIRRQREEREPGDDAISTQRSRA